ncbi:MAG TPA: hypothetical protein DIS62_03385, partial [Candidatus Kerfeldbacteria bacterium]|nr:hypothetical protein [Candidatus Kerfeldbacteria bacterium]
MYYMFVVYFVFYIVSSFILLIKSYKHSNGVQKVQLTYLFFGLLLSVIFGATTNLVLPLVGHSQLSNLGSYSTIFLASFTAYAITRHHFLDIRIIILRTITYSLIVILISASIIGLAILLPDRLNASISNKTFIAVIVSVFIVLILDPLKRFIANITDKLLYKKGIDYQKLLSDLSNVINQEIDLDKLVTQVEHQLV